MNANFAPHAFNILTVAVSAAIFTLPLQAGAQSQNLYFNDITDNDSSYISNPSNWFTDAGKTERFDGSLDGSYDGYISGQGALTVKVAAHQKPVFGNLYYSLSEFNAGGDSMVFGNDCELRTVGDLSTNFTLSEESSVEYGQQLTQKITLWTNAKIRIGGDWLINVDRNGSKDYMSLRITEGGTPGTASVQVAGDVVAASGTFIFSTDNLNFSAGGSMRLGGSQWNLLSNNTQSETFTRTVGGIGEAGGGGGSVRFNIAKENWVTAPARTVNLVLANSSAYDVSGSFAMHENSLDMLNIIMTASDARNGRQTLRFGSTSSYWCNSTQMSNANINNAAVSSGRLDIGMHSGMKGNNLSIEGYSGNAADAVFSAAGLSAGEDVGRVQFDSMTFHEGTIVFDLAEIDCDFIQINGGVTKLSDSAKIVFDINVAKDDLQMYLEVLGAETIEWNLMSFKSDDSDFDVADIILKTQAGIGGELNFLADGSSGLTTVQLSLGLVPEPSAIAAILGAFALAFAIRRAKK